MAFAVLRFTRWLERRATPPRRRHWAVDPAQIQGLLVDGREELPYAGFFWLAFADVGSLGAFLDLQLLAAEALDFAVTARLLRRLQLPAETLAGFDSSFLTGMSAPERSRRLQDVAGNAPEHWHWGAPEQHQVDLLVCISAIDHTRLSQLSAALRSSLDRFGATCVHELETGYLPDRREHFGFRSGLSQPCIAADMLERERRGVFVRGDAANTVAPGEFLLGYTNEFDELPASAEVPSELDPGSQLPASRSRTGWNDLGRNGSYMVVRQLEQDVFGFWSRLDALSSEALPRELLAAKVVGRWRSGAPLALAPEHDNPAYRDRDGFGYADDPHGFRCPIGAHIRRANVRDWQLAPTAAQASLMSNHHRILRRSRPYGAPLAASLEPDAMLAAGDDGAARGLLFICFNADLSRQFEFIQESWLMNDFFGRLRDEVDPLLGHVQDVKHFTIPQRPIARRCSELPSAVRVRGGAYYFLPSKPALRFIARRAATVSKSSGESV